MRIVEPWTVDGLPYGLTVEHFRAAIGVWVDRLPATVGDDRLRAIDGVAGGVKPLAGYDYEENQPRVAALRAMEPAFGRSHPGILVPDPSKGADGMQPVGVVTVVGYVGSVWSVFSGAWHRKVRRDLDPLVRCFWVTSVSFGEYGPTAWLPKRD